MNGPELLAPGSDFALAWIAASVLSLVVAASASAAYVRIVRSLRALRQDMQRAGAGVRPRPLAIPTVGEVSPLAEAFNRLLDGVRAANEALEETNHNLEVIVTARTDQLQRSERKYRSLVGQASVGILLWDPDSFAIQEANARAGELLGERPRDLLKRGLDEVFAEASREGAIRALRRVNEVGTVRLEETLMERTGHGPFPVELGTSLIRLGEDTVVLGILQDLSEKKELERRAALSNEQVRRNERMASIGQLAAGVAHEINNPMGYVASNINRLVEYAKHLEDLVQRSTADMRTADLLGEIDELVRDVEEIAQDANEGVARVTDIVRALREFSYGGHADQSMQWVDLNNVINNCLTLARNEIKNRAVVDVEFGDIPRVRCQPTQIAQVVMNLLRNAAQATEPPGRIFVGTYSGSERVHLVVEDDGCGIDPAKLPQIFDPFFTTKEVGHGTGLGLSVSREMVQTHGGEIWVDSAPRCGTRFVVELPVSGPIGRRRP